MNVRVFATTSFEGFHCWPDAPAEVAFLRTMHRHRFHVRVEVAVNMLDREVEFILLQRKVCNLIGFTLEQTDVGTWSCERWATFLLDRLGAARVEVNEDGENGSIVEA